MDLWEQEDSEEDEEQVLMHVIEIEEKESTQTLQQASVIVGQRLAEANSFSILPLNGVDCVQDVYGVPENLVEQSSNGHAEPH